VLEGDDAAGGHTFAGAAISYLQFFKSRVLHFYVCQGTTECERISRYQPFKALACKRRGQVNTAGEKTDAVYIPFAHFQVAATGLVGGDGDVGAVCRTKCHD